MTNYIFDCDDVLLDWMGGFLKYVRRCGINPDPAGPTTWDMTEWLSTTPSHARHLIMDFNMTHEFSRLESIANAVSTINRLRDAGHTLSVLTACGDHMPTRRLRLDNLRDNFGNMFTRIDVLPLGASKFDWLYQYTRHRDPRGAVLVEDNYKHALSGAANRIKSYCIRKRHNRYDEGAQESSSVIWIDDISEVV